MAGLAPTASTLERTSPGPAAGDPGLYAELAGTTAAPAGLPPSPLASASFGGLAGTDFTTQPDIAGAVGPNHLMLAVNSGIRFQDRVGNTIRIQSLDSFWTNGVTSPDPEVFDPRLVYEPYGQRWIFTAAANYTNNPGLLLAVSKTSDPTPDPATGWYRWFIDVDTTTPLYATTPTVGFSKDRVVIQANMYFKSNDTYYGSYIYAFTRTSLFAGGSGSPRRFVLLAADQGGPENAPVPAATYDTTTSTNFFLGNLNGNYQNFGYIQIYSLGGPLGSESLQAGAYYGGPPWDHYPPGPAFLPQLGTTNKIDAGDSRIHNVVLRDALLLAAQTVFYPATAPTRSAVQWWQVSPGGGFLAQQGVVDDPSGTVSRAYPSIAANAAGEILLGYSRFSAAEYPGAYYSFQAFNDPFLYQMRPEMELKAGEGPFQQKDPSGIILWGRWSAATVDPNNDYDLWTLQEYAYAAGPGTNTWGTWWGRVSPPVDLALTASLSSNPALQSSNLTYSLAVTNNYGNLDGGFLASGVRITNTLPPGAVFVSASASQGSCTYSNGVVTCRLGTLASGAQATATVTIQPTVTGPNTNVVVVVANGPDEQPSDNTALLVANVLPATDLAVAAFSVPDPATAGSNFTCQILVTNQGLSSASTVVLTNTLPTNVTFVSASASQGSCAHSAGVVSCSLGTIVSRGAVTVSIVENPQVSGGFLTNRVRVRCATAELNLADNNTNLVTRLNSAPTLQAIADQASNEDTPIGPLSFTVGDAETPASNLVVTASSSNPALVPNANILLGGSGANRTITLTPLPDQSGSTTITRTVTDGDGTSLTRTFVATFRGVNDPPTLNAIADVAVNEDAAPFTVPLAGITSGAANEIQTLNVTAVSANPGKIPNPAVSYSSPNPTGTLTLTPNANSIGPATITVTVNDNGASNNTISRTFTVTLNPVNDPPTLDAIPNLTIDEDAGAQTVALSGIGSGAANETNALSITVSNSNATLLTNFTVNYTSPNTAGTLSFDPVTNAFGSAVVTVTVNDGNPSNNLVRQNFTVTVNPLNDRPTLDPISSFRIDEDPGLATVNLTGISAGAPNENQPLTFATSNSNPALVTGLAVNYTNGSSTGTLTFTTASNATGSATLTVTVNDGASTNNTRNRTFTVTVDPVNDPPALDPLPNLTLDEDSGLQTLTLTGISSGAPDEVQTMRLSATSSDPGLIPNPTVGYTSPSSSGTLSFTPAPNASGLVTITVTVDDRGASNNLTVRSFVVTINDINDPPTLDPLGNLTLDEDAGLQTVSLTGISSGAPVENQSLLVTANSSDPSLLGNLAVNYISPAATGTLTFIPATNAAGSAVITVQVNDGAGSNNIVTRSFTVTINPVNDPPALNQPQDLTVLEDAGPQIVNLSGIGSGAPNETQVLTVTATSGNPSLIANPIAVSYTSPSPAGTLTLTPLPNAHGTAIITVTARDNGTSNNITTRTFTLTVTPVNDLPFITQNLPSRVTDEDVPVTVPFVAWDTETAPASLVLEASSSNEELVSGADIRFGGSGTNRTVIVTPLPDQFGDATIFLQVTDSDGGTATTFFDLTVNPVDDPLVISFIPDQVTDEDTPTPAIPFTVEDVDSPVGAITVSAVSSNQTLVPNANILLGGSGGNRTIRLTPATNQFGVALISIQAFDGQTNLVRTFQLTVNSVNDRPTITTLPDRTVNEDTATGPLAFVIGDLETPAGSLTLAGSSSHPALVPPANIVFSGSGSNRAVTVTPALNQFGTATVTVTVTDGNSGSASASFLLTVLALNDPPTLAPLADQSTPEDVPLSIPLVASDPETPLGALLITATSDNQTVVPDSNLTVTDGGASRSLNVTPASNQSGAANITVTVRDSDGVSVSDTFLLTVPAVNDPPTLDPIANLTLNEDSGQQVVVLDGITSGAPNESQALTVTATSSAPGIIPHPAITYTSPNPSGTLTFTPTPNSNGTVTVTVTVNDQAATNNLFSRTFTVTVVSINDLPVISPVADRTIAEDTATGPISFTVGDVETPAGSLVLSAGSSNPTLVPTNNAVFGGSGANRTVTVTPATNQFGFATLTLRLTDASGGTTSTSFKLTVTPVSDPPTITDIPNQSLNEDGVLAPVAFVVGDAETTPGELVVTAYSSNPALVPDSAITLGGSGANRTVAVTPTPGQSGSATLTVMATDANGLSASDTFTLTVTPINDPPTISAMPNLTLDEDAATGPLPFAVGDLESPVGSLTVTATSSNTNLVPAANLVLGGSGANRSVTVTPLANQFGSATISLSVTDTNNASTSTSFTLTVNPVNDLPTLNPISNLTLPEDAGLQTVNLTGITCGPANENQSITIAALSSNPALIPNPGISYTSPNTTGTLNFTPVASANGTATVTVTVSDGTSATRRTFSVTVTPTNSVPTISAVTDLSTPEDTPVTVPFTIGDAETPAGLLILSATSTNANLVAVTNILFEGNGSTRTARIIPTPNASGTSQIRIRVSDGVLTNSAAFLLTVTSANDAPTLDPISSLSLLRSTTTSVPLSGISSGAPNESQALTLSVTTSDSSLFSTQPSVTYTSPNSTGTVSFRTASNKSGAATLTVTVNDGQATSNTFQRSFVVYVRDSANTVPTLSTIADRAITENATTGPISFTIGDAGTPATSLVVSGTSSNQVLVPTNNLVFGGSGSNRTVTITPASNRSGTTLITIGVADTAYGYASTNFVLTVNPVNDPPTIANIPDQATLENVPTALIPFTVSDPETPAASLQVTAIASNPTLVPANGIELGGNGTNRVLRITPAPQQSGTATLTVSVTDGTSTATDTFLLTVTGLNDPPVISDLSDLTLSEDTSSGALAFTVGDAETAAGSLTLTSASSNPALLPTSNIVFGGSGSNRSVTLTPLPNQFGTSTVTITVTDASLATASDTFLLTVAPINDAPTLDAIGNLALAQNAPLQTVNLTGLGTGAANETQLLIVAAGSSNPALIPAPAVNYTSPATTGTLTFTPMPNTNGTATITVTVSDAQAQNSTVTRTFTVTVNGTPTLSTIFPQVTLEDTATAAIPFTVGDDATPAGSLTVTAGSSNPALVPSANISLGGSGANRTVTVTPAPEQSGSAFITLTATDAGGAAATRRFLLVVDAVNDRPTLNPINNLVIDEDAGTQTVSLAGISTGAANESQALTCTAVSSNPSLIPDPTVTYVSPNSTGTVSFRPQTNANGTATITVTVDDGQFTNSTILRTFTVTVNPVNDPPTLDPIGNVTVDEDAPAQTVSLTGLSAGAANETQSLTVNAASSNPSVVPHPVVTYTSPNPTGSLSVTPSPNANGSATITVTIGDGAAASNTTTRTFTVTVRPVNDPPTLQPVADLSLALNPGTQTVNLTGITAGVTNESQALTLTALSSDPAIIPHPTVTYTSPNTTGSLRFTPPPDASGNATITITVRDDGGTANGGQDTFQRTFQVSLGELRLRIQPQGTQVALFWSTNATGYRLEGRNAFAAGNAWTPVPGTPVTVGREFKLTVPASGSAKFFRLAQASSTGPLLRVARQPGPGRQIALYWPADAAGYLLESKPTLATGAAWTLVPGTPEVIGTELRLVLPADGPAAYFRLRQP